MASEKPCVICNGKGGVGVPERPYSKKQAELIVCKACKGDGVEKGDGIAMLKRHGLLEVRDGED